MAETIPGAQAKANAAQAAAIAASTPASHATNTSNPHNVTKAQVGLGNVDNTSDANKPVSTAQMAAINTRNPYGFNFTVDPGSIRSGDALGGTAGAAVYMRVRDAATITKIGLYCTVSSGTISVAVHSNTGTGRASLPGTQVATSGSVACPAVGYAEISLGGTVSVAAGDWFVLTFSDTVSRFSSLLSATSFPNSLGAGRQGIVSSGSHPAPATPGALQPSIGYTICLIGVP